MSLSVESGIQYIYTKDCLIKNYVFEKDSQNLCIFIVYIRILCFILYNLKYIIIYISGLSIFDCYANWIHNNCKFLYRELKDKEIVV